MNKDYFKKWKESSEVSSASEPSVTDVSEVPKVESVVPVDTVLPTSIATALLSHGTQTSPPKRIDDSSQTLEKENASKTEQRLRAFLQYSGLGGFKEFKNVACQTEESSIAIKKPEELQVTNARMSADKVIIPKVFSEVRSTSSLVKIVTREESDTVDETKNNLQTEVAKPDSATLFREDPGKVDIDGKMNWEQIDLDINKSSSDSATIATEDCSKVENVNDSWEKREMSRKTEDLLQANTERADPGAEHHPEGSSKAESIDSSGISFEITDEVHNDSSEVYTNEDVKLEKKTDGKSARMLQADTAHQNNDTVNVPKDDAIEMDGEDNMAWEETDHIDIDLTEMEQAHAGQLDSDEVINKQNVESNKIVSDEMTGKSDVIAMESEPIAQTEKAQAGESDATGTWGCSVVHCLNPPFDASKDQSPPSGAKPALELSIEEEIVQTKKIKTESLAGKLKSFAMSTLNSVVGHSPDQSKKSGKVTKRTKKKRNHN